MRRPLRAWTPRLAIVGSRRATLRFRSARHTPGSLAASNLGNTHGARPFPQADPEADLTRIPYSRPALTRQWFTPKTSRVAGG